MHRFFSQLSNILHEQLYFSYISVTLVLNVINHDEKLLKGSKRESGLRKVAVTSLMDGGGGSDWPIAGT